jgi:hypothetical protein
MSSTIYLAATGSFPAYNSTGGVSPTFDTVNNRVYFTDATTSGSGVCPFVNFGSQTFNIGTLGFTIIVDFQFVGTAQTFERIMDFNSGASGVQDMFLSRIGSGSTMRFQYKEGGVEQTLDTTFTFSQGTRYTVAAVYNPNIGTTGLQSIYVNGVLIQNKTPATKGTDKVYTNTWFGRSSYTADPALSAYIYSANVYNRALSMPEITGYQFSYTPYIPSNILTTYTPSTIVPDATVNNTYETLDLISQAASLAPSTSNAAIINQWITKMIRTKTPTSGDQPFWSNVSRYSNVVTIPAYGYIGGVTAQDGRVFMTAFGGTNTGVFNPKTNSYTTISGVLQGYAGGVLLRDGRIMLTPYSPATNIGLINPVTMTYTSGPAATNYMGACLVPDGRVVMSPTGNQKWIGVYNPITNTFTSYTGNGWQGVGVTYPYDGACLIPDGRVIFAPGNGFAHIGIFDYLTNSFTSVPTASQNLSSPVYHPNGNVYMSPSNVANIGIFNTVSNTFTTFSGITTGLRGSCLLPDGRIMFSPVGSNITFTNIYNPYTNSLTTVTGLPINSFLGCTVLRDGRVLMIPWSVSLGIISGGIPPHPDMCVHPVFNKF